MLTLPLIVAGLGQVRYAAYLALAALVAWTSPLGFGLLPALTRQLADIAARGNVTVEARLVGAGFWVSLTIGVFLAFVAAIVASTVDIGTLSGVGAAVAPREMTLGFAAAMGVMSLHSFATVSTAVRAGYQENFISNILSLLANLLIVGGMLILRRHPGTIAAYILVIYLPFTAMFLLDVAAIFLSRPKLWPPRLPRRDMLVHGDIRALFATSGVTWAAQIHYFLTVFGTVLLVSHAYRAGDTAAFGSVMRATVLANSMVGLFIWPLVPALSDATARGEMAWVRRCYRWLLIASLGGALVFAAVLVVAGPQLFEVWLGRSVAPSAALCTAFAVYFVGSTLNFVNFNVLLALGDTRYVGRAYVIEAVLVYALAATLSPRLGFTGVAWALAAAAFGVNGWLLPLKVVRRLRQAPDIAAHAA